MADKTDNGRKAKKRPPSRELILLAARDKFEEKGFHAATTSEIARQAGVAEGTIFNYFKTKKDLLFALLEPFKIEVMGDFFSKATGNTDKDSLHLYLKNHLAFVKENLALFNILLYESRFYPELHEQFINKVVLKTLEPIELHLAEGARNGKYRNIDPPIAARAFFGMVAVFVAWSDILEANKYEQFEESTIIEEVVDIFMNGIKMQP